MNNLHRNIVLYGSLVLMSVGCSTLTGVSSGRLIKAESIAGKAGLLPMVIETPYFKIQSFSRIASPGRPVRVYIEGDGLAWRSRTRISEDPTPIHPIALELAAEDPSDNIVYLARPCQYVADSACHSSIWGSARFSEDVISSVNFAIDYFKRTANASSVELVGFSGGGAVAVLATAKRGDVLSIMTVAGNLSSGLLSSHHRVSPLRGSLDPIDAAKAVANIPQQHYVGKEDRLVPFFVAEDYWKASGYSKNVRISIIEGASHMQGWTKKWREILRSLK